MKKREASVESVLPEAGAEGCRVTGPDCEENGFAARGFREALNFHRMGRHLL